MTSMYHKVEIMLFSAVAALCVTAAEYDVAAYVWPAYHPEPRWAELGIFKDGKGEWQNVWEAVPKWEGHRQPLVPLWGYENEADPKVVEKKIDAAVSHGVQPFGRKRHPLCDKAWVYHVVQIVRGDFHNLWRGGK